MVPYGVKNLEDSCSIPMADRTSVRFRVGKHVVEKLKAFSSPSYERSTFRLPETPTSLAVDTGDEARDGETPKIPTPRETIYYPDQVVSHMRIVEKGGF